MSHKEALMKLSEEELNVIYQRLGLPPFNNIKKPWLSNSIAKCYEDVKNFRRVITQFSSITMKDLELHAHVQKPLDVHQKKELSDYGILVEGELPEDFKRRICQWSRLNYVTTFPSKSEEVVHGFLLNVLLVLLYFDRMKSIKLTRKKNNSNFSKLLKELCMDNEIAWEQINILVKTGLISKTKDLYELNSTAFTKWKNDQISRQLMTIYKTKLGEREWLFLQKVSDYQNQPNEWVDMTVISNTSIEYNQVKQLGLIWVHKDQEKTYVQLTPESWFLTKKEFHPLWTGETILVSASFEVFVPYHYDPFVLFELMPYCSLKDSDYFLVFNIELDCVKKNEKAKEFYQTLVAISSNIPSVVDYDLKSLIK
ncbi:hypothetical protein V7068_20565 [Bacillus sp. JJ634]